MSVACFCCLSIPSNHPEAPNIHCKVLRCPSYSASAACAPTACVSAARPAGFPPSGYVLVRLYPEMLTRAASGHPAPPAPAPAHRARPPEPPYPPPGHSAYHRNMYWEIPAEKHGGDLAVVSQVYACDPRSSTSAAASSSITLCVSRELTISTSIQHRCARVSARSRRSARSLRVARVPPSAAASSSSSV